MKTRIHKMLVSGSTTGAISGWPRAWGSGQLVEAPEGEFAHLSDGTFEVLTAKEAKAEAEEVETAQATPEAETATKKPAKKSTRKTTKK